MSYDFYIEVDTGGPEPHCIDPYLSGELAVFESDGVAGTVLVTAAGYARCGNYTSNVSGMWRKCLTAALEAVPGARARIGTDATGSLCLRDLQGAPCSELAPLLAAAVEWGIEHIAELREDNPENGWGNAEGAVTYLWDIQRMCEQYPNGRLRISS